MQDSEDGQRAFSTFRVLNGDANVIERDQLFRNMAQLCSYVSDRCDDEQVAQYDARQRLRLEVRPGITGWAQVQGRAAIPWSERIELDIWYVENESLRLDLRILVATVRMVISGDDLYRGDKGGWDS